MVAALNVLRKMIKNDQEGNLQRHLGVVDKLISWVVGEELSNIIRVVALRVLCEVMSCQRAIRCSIVVVRQTPKNDSADYCVLIYEACTLCLLGQSDPRLA